MKFLDRLTGKVKKRAIVLGLTVALGLAGVTVNPALIGSAGEFIFILTEGGQSAEIE